MTRKRHVLVGRRAGRRQSPAMSSDDAPADDKVSRCRRTMHRPTRKSHDVVGRRTGRRQSAIFSTMGYPEDRLMHPSGVQFGLSQGLLEVRNEEVLLSHQLVDAIFGRGSTAPSTGQAADSGQLPGGHDDPGCAGTRFKLNTRVAARRRCRSSPR